MDFKKITEIILSRFRDQGVSYALIGGYAVGLWGVPRGTVDMDFLVPMDDMEKVKAIMASLGYETYFSSENVTQFVSPVTSFGEIDFLHAFREASLGMLERAVERSIFGNGLTIKVLIPEDLIGLKVQALSNDERREALDMHDIKTLMSLHGKVMDWGLIGQYFAIFDLSELFCELERSYHAS